MAMTLIENIHLNGFAKPFERLNLKYRFAHCLIDSDYYYAIGADGKIYKCNELIDDHRYAVGDVFAGISHKPQQESISNECYSCGFLPICQGGCKLRRNSSDIHAKCQMEKHIIERLLSLYFA